MTAKNEAKKDLRSSLRRALVIGGLIALALFGLVFLMTNPARGTDIGNCSAPDGYTFVSNVMAADLGEKQVFIARAIVGMGQINTGGQQVVIPACGSSDPSLQNVADMFVMIDGKLAFIANGAVGMAVPLAPAPQP